MLQVCRLVASILREVLSVSVMGSQHNLDILIRRESHKPGEGC
jgi:hypothetical protein